MTAIPQHAAKNGEAGAALQAWQCVRLADFAQTCSGTTPSRGRKEFYDGQIPWVKTGELLDGEIFNTEEHVTEAAVNESSLRLLPKGTVLVAMYGQGQTRGRTGLLRCEATTNQACFAILPNERFAPEFLQFWFRLSYQRLRTMTEGRGGNQPNLNGQVLREELIPLPPLPEQRRIAARLRGQLAEVAQARAAIEAQLAAAQALPAAHLRAVFESDAAKRWPKRKLVEILTDTRNGLYKPDTFCGRGQRILKMFNIGRFNGVWNLNRVDLIEVTPGEQDIYGLKIGDILLNRVNSRELVGKCAVVDEQTTGAVFESKNIRLRIDRRLALSDYVATCLNAFGGRQHFESRLKQIVGQATVNRSDLDSLELPLPELELQHEVSSKLDAEKREAANLVNTLADKLAALEKLPAALLREAFAGTPG